MAAGMKMSRKWLIAQQLPEVIMITPSQYGVCVLQNELSASDIAIDENKPDVAMILITHGNNPSRTAHVRINTHTHIHTHTHTHTHAHTAIFVSATVYIRYIYYYMHI